MQSKTSFLAINLGMPYKSQVQSKFKRCIYPFMCTVNYNSVCWTVPCAAILSYFRIAGDLKTQEVECINNNRKVAESCDLIFLCVLPSQLTSVADEIRGHLQTHSIVYR